MAPPAQPLVSIIIPVFNLWDYTLRCLMSVLRHTSHISHEVIMVDDASTDDTREGLPQLEGIRLLRNEKNQGFARNNNAAASVALGKYILFLNNDTEVHARWLDEMLAVIQGAPDVGMVGSKLLFPDGTIQHAGVAFLKATPTPISPFHLDYKKPASHSTSLRDLNAVTAACALMPKELFLSLGGFDEGFRMGCEDVDLCLRVRAAGYRIVYTPHSVVTHFESLSEGRFVASRRNEERLHEKWLDSFTAFETISSIPGKPFSLQGSVPRAAISVVVAVHDHLSSAPPCLENIVTTLGPDDELILVDDGSLGAVAKYLRQFVQIHGDRCKLLRLEEYQGLASAWRAGLQAATKPFAAAVLCTWRVVDNWVERTLAHLATDSRIGVLCATEIDSSGLSSIDLLTPVPRRCGGLALPIAAPETQATEFISAGVVVASRLRLLDLTTSCPEGVPGGHPEGWSRSLQKHGLALSRAPDVTAYRFNQMFPDCGPAARTQYLRNVSAAMDGDERSRPPVSIVMVARNFPDTLTQALDALFAHTARRIELVVVDDGSVDALATPFEMGIRKARPNQLLTARLIRNATPQGFPAAINQGLVGASGQLVVVMNADVVVTPHWLVRTAALLGVNPNIGIVSPVVNVGPRPQCCAQPNFAVPAEPIDQFAGQRAADFFGVFGAMPRLAGVCLVIRRGVIEDIGGFDPRYGDDGGDVEDFCLRAARSGYLSALACEAYVEYLGNLSARWLDLHPRRPAPSGWHKFCARWGLPIDTTGVPPDAASLLRIFRPDAGFDPRTDHVPLTAVAPGRAT